MKQTDHAALAACLGHVLLGNTGALGVAAYFLGCAFVDSDMLFFPEGGHRTRSPLHDIRFGAAAFLAGALLSGGTGVLGAFLMGIAVHQLGDFLQGGLGMGRGRRIGFTGFKWDKYSGKAGKAIGILLRLGALLALHTMYLSGAPKGTLVAYAACAGLGMVASDWKRGLAVQAAVFGVLACLG